MERRHAGAHNELLATVWLLRQGYDVFRNVSAHGEIDIIAKKDGETILIDVKSAAYRTDGSMSCPTLSKEQIDKGVVCLRVFPDGECSIDTQPPTKGASGLRHCVNCGTSFKFTLDRQKYCSRSCRLENWQTNNLHFGMRHGSDPI